MYGIPLITLDQSFTFSSAYQKPFVAMGLSLETFGGLFVAIQLHCTCHIGIGTQAAVNALTCV